MVFYSTIYIKHHLFQLMKNYKIHLNKLIEQIKSEMQNPGLAQYELLISYMKIFLISASRSKTEQQPHSHAIKKRK